MGLSASFVVRPEGSGWVNEKVARLSATGVAAAASEGPAVVARVLHSDVCFVLGRVGGRDDWRWVFNEVGAGLYPEEFDASAWIDIDDPDALEDSRDERAAAAAAAVVAWAAGTGLNSPDQRAVQDVLSAGYTFAQEGFFELLAVLGIDAPITELDDKAPAEQAYVEQVDPTPRRPRRPRAIAIDHSSLEWNRIDAYELEFRFGEPPCVLSWEGSDFVLSDPPVSVVAGAVSAGQWVDVPPEHAGDFLTAATWARTHVGKPGQPPADTRPVLVIDDPPPELHGWKEMPLSFLYERADPAQVLVRLEIQDDFDRDVVADLASSCYDRLVSRTVASIGKRATVTYGGDNAAQGWGLVVGGMTSRADGYRGMTKATESAWQRVVAKLRTGELTAATCWIRRTDAYGRGALQKFSHMDATFSIWRDREDPDSTAPILTVSVDLPYFANLFRPEEATTFARTAVESLPVRRGYIHIGRWPDSTDHWVDILPASNDPDTDNYAIAESHGDLAWLQRTVKPPHAIVEI